MFHSVSLKKVSKKCRDNYKNAISFLTCLGICAEKNVSNSGKMEISEKKIDIGKIKLIYVTIIPPIA
jgi:hypothetical protein